MTHTRALLPISLLSILAAAAPALAQGAAEPPPPVTEPAAPALPPPPAEPPPPPAPAVAPAPMAPPPPAWGAQPPPVAPYGAPYGMGPPAWAPPPPGWQPPLPQELPPGGEGAPANVSKKGLPLARRGTLALDSGAFLDTDGQAGVASSELSVSLPLADHTFFDGVVPFSVLAPLGNPTLGAHHTAKLTDGLWLTAGGALGIPLLPRRGILDSRAGAVPKAYWNLHYYTAQIVPLSAQIGLDVHTKAFEFRVHAEPVIYFPLGRTDGVGGAFQHAFEVQAGHRIGVGVRLQGVVVGPGRDHYQAAIEPYFAMEGDLAFLRTGFMMPLDSELGPAFEESWGFLLATGIRID